MNLIEVVHEGFKNTFNVGIFRMGPDENVRDVLQRVSADFTLDIANLGGYPLNEKWSEKISTTKLQTKRLYNFIY